MQKDLYEADGLAWAEHQASLLRRLAAGERVNEFVDWPNVIEEIEAMGRSELRACEGPLRQALIHLLKLFAWPRSQATAHWQREALIFLFEAQEAFSPSMRQRISLAALHRSALRRVQITCDDTGEPRRLPETCPFELDELLAMNPDVPGLVARLGGE